METPKRRGRPPKGKTVNGATVSTAVLSPSATNPGPFNGRPNFVFRLNSVDGIASLDLADRKGHPVKPDFRRFAGSVRDALREYGADLWKQALDFRWNREDGEDAAAIYSPSPRLIDLAAASGLLADCSGRLLRIAPGVMRLVLAIRECAKNFLDVRPEIDRNEFDPDSSALNGLAATEGDALVAAEPPVVRTVSPNHAIMDGTLYRTIDLGSRWAEASGLGARIRRDELPVFLSLALSRFPSLDLRYGNYQVKRTRPRVAVPALVFKEIDPYGFLHVRPAAFLPGYPPGFFEDQDIVKVVELEEDEKLLGIAEVVFPTAADDLLRGILSRYGKESKSEVYEEAGHFIIAPDFAERFLSETMAEIMSSFTLFQSETLVRYKLRPVKPRLRLSMGAGIGYLEGRADLIVADQAFSYGRFMAEYRKNGYLALNDGSRAYPDNQEIARLERLIHKTKGDDDAVTVSFFDIPALTADRTLEADGEAWKRAEGFYRGFNAISDRDGDFSLSGGSLRPYQSYGVKWLEYLRDHDLGGCLADEMGLGKTVQVISMLRRAYAAGLAQPSLILMPRSLLFNWRAELNRFAPELSCLVHHGADRDTSNLVGATARIILSSYGTVRNDIGGLAELEFAYLILDESQSVKNTETKTSAAVMSLKARHRLALSGTPVENNLGELYALFNFLNPAFFGPFADFSRRYLRPIQERQDETALRDLKARLYPFILRRLKRDVLRELPPKTEQTAYIELDAEHLGIYERRRVELKVRVDRIIAELGIMKGAFAILQAFTELRRLAGVPEADGEYGGVSAKREYLRDQVAELVANGSKCLIFTNFLATVELVSEDLAAMGIQNLVMTGATGDRETLVQRFQTDPAIGAFIMTVKTGGVGLNLTAADYVFILDPWWNRAAESQAIDRTHRIGQTNPVFCYRMIAKDTIEEKILELQERKAQLADSLLSADASAIKSLDENDIAYLLG